MRVQWGDEVAARTTAHRLPAGAVLTGHDDFGTPCVWAMGAVPTTLGAFLGWASHQAAAHLHLCVDAPADDVAALARRATAFDLPVTTWHVDGVTLVEVPPAPLNRPASASAEVLAAFSPIIEAAGAEVIVEEGVLRAEVLGLEVARVVSDADAGFVLEVGVGRHDREAHTLLGSGGVTQLPDVVATVRGQRTADASSSPANQLAPERWLRAVVVRQPELVGAASLVAIPAPIPRPDLGRRVPAPAMGTDGHGQAVVVVCSVGIDPELVPLAADVRFAAALAALGDGDTGHVSLVLVVPEGDDHPLTRQLAGLLRHPANVVTVGKDWRRQ